MKAFEYTVAAIRVEKIYSAPPNESFYKPYYDDWKFGYKNTIEQLGLDGWELVSVNYHVEPPFGIFKRETEYEP